jgi:glucosamine kinase
LPHSRGGQFREIGGKGLVLGDEASGAWLGRRGASSRGLDRARGSDGFDDAVDGFRQMTPLLAQMLDENAARPDGVVAFANRAAPADLCRAFAPRDHRV